MYKRNNETLCRRKKMIRFDSIRFDCVFEVYFLSLFPDYSRMPGLIRGILLLIKRLYFSCGPIATKSGSDDGIPEKLRGSLKIYKEAYCNWHTLCSRYYLIKLFYVFATYKYKKSIRIKYLIRRLGRNKHNYNIIYIY